MPATSSKLDSESSNNASASWSDDENTSVTVGACKRLCIGTVTDQDANINDNPVDSINDDAVLAADHRLDTISARFQLPDPIRDQLDPTITQGAICC